MPIVFSVSECGTYYTARYEGHITDAAVLAGYEAWFRGGAWKPDMSELADLSEADLRNVTSSGIYDLARMMESVTREYGTNPRVAVYAPRDLPYGLAMVFSAQAERFESHRVFRDIEEAVKWLCCPDQEHDRSDMKGDPS